MTTKTYLRDHQEEKIARFTDLAYRAVLEQGFVGSFLDLELSLWNAIRQSVENGALRPRETAESAA
jgi:hypothetical protein